MTYEEIQALHDQSLMPTYGRFPVALCGGHGARAVDESGREYIDFGAGIGVNALGYCDPGWVEAVQKQAATAQHFSNLYYNDVQVAFAGELCAAAHMSRAFLCNSGAEANECAIKLARKYSYDTYGEGRHTIVTLVNSFHGRTVTTLSATGQESFHTLFYPFTEGFAYARAGDLDDLSGRLNGTVCAVLLECVQGEGGVVPLDPGYLRGVEALCRERDVLLMVDEVQTGASRTGRFLACEHAGILPDVVTMAKGLGGGLPIGACLCGEKLKDVMGPGTHGSTFGGNPVACAAGRYMLSRLTDPALLQEVTRKGERIARRVSRMPDVQEVRGLGMMQGIVLRTLDAKAVAAACVQNGLLILTAKTLLRLLPPLNIPDEDLEAGLDILESTLKGLVNV